MSRPHRPVVVLLVVLLAGGCAPAGGVRRTEQARDERRAQVDEVTRVADAVVDGLERRLDARAEPRRAGFVSCALGERYAVDVQLRGFGYLDDPAVARELAVIEDVVRGSGLDAGPGPGRGSVVGARGDVRAAVSAPPTRRVEDGPTRALRTVSVFSRCRLS